MGGAKEQWEWLMQRLRGSHVDPGKTREKMFRSSLAAGPQTVFPLKAELLLVSQIMGYHSPRSASEAALRQPSINKGASPSYSLQHGQRLLKTDMGKGERGYVGRDVFGDIHDAVQLHTHLRPCSMLSPTPRARESSYCQGPGLIGSQAPACGK